MLVDAGKMVVYIFLGNFFYVFITSLFIKFA